MKYSAACCRGVGAKQRRDRRRDLRRSALYLTLDKPLRTATRRTAPFEPPETALCGDL